MSCPDEHLLLRYIERQCNDAERRELDEHAESCSECRSLLRGLSRNSLASGASETRDASEQGEPLPGDLVGRFVLLRRIGRGGMGIVYLAYDPKLDRNVALKLLRGTADDTRHERFEAEARAMARMTHPNVVRVYDFGEWQGRAYLTMEYVDGVDLATWCRQSPRRAAQVLDVCREAARGLVAAHEAGLVHRDIKPHNIFIGAEGRALIGDFGLASVTGEGVGTPAYMAPEQFGGDVTAKSDQYSFAMTVREALTGEAPTDEPHATIDGWLLAVLDRARAADPQDRYPDMMAFAEALTPRRRPGRVLALVAATLALVVAGGGWLWARAGSERACAQPEAPMQSVWNAERRLHLDSQLREHHERDDFAQRLGEEINVYAASWVSLRREVCEATRIRGEQSEELLDRRMLCLDRRRGALHELLETFVRRPELASIDAVEGLPALADCSDVENMSELQAQPGDPASRRAIAALYARLDRARVERSAIELAPVRQEVDAIVLEARSLSYGPLVAEALFRAADLAHLAADVPAADRHVREAIEVASASHHDELTARASILLVGLTSVLGGDPDESRALETAARAAVARAGASDALRYQLEYTVAIGLMVSGQYSEAESALERARDLGLRAYGEDSLELGHYRNVLADLYLMQARADEARVHLDAILKLREHKLGSFHPDVATALNDLASASLQLGEVDRAKALLLRSSAIFEVIDPKGVLRAGGLVNLGVISSQLGELDEADRYFQKALPLLESHHGRKHMSYTTALHGLAMLREDQGKLIEAEALHRDTLELRIELLGAEHPLTARSHEGLGGVLRGLGRYTEAIEEHEKASRIFDDAGIAGLAPLPRISIAHCRRAMADWPAAITASERALESALSTGDPRWIAEARALLAASHLEKGLRTARVRQLVTEAIAAYRQIDADDPEDELYAFLVAHQGVSP